MPKPPYESDAGLYARVAALEQRAQRIESGGLLRGPSVLFQARQNLAGPWPNSTTFNVNNPNSQVVICWSATGFVTSGSLNIALKIDGITSDNLILSTSLTPNVHLSAGFGVAVLTSFSVGSHTAQIALVSGLSDANDVSHLVVLELPQ